MIRNTSSLLAGVAVSAALWTMPAMAQDAAVADNATAGGLEDIIVTARKRQESVQDVPVAVTAISAELVQRQDLTSIEKIAAPNGPPVPWRTLASARESVSAIFSSSPG